MDPCPHTQSRPLPLSGLGDPSTPEKGIDAVPVTALGDNPGSPIVGTPEYNYDLTSPPSPKDPSPSSPSSAASESLAAGNKTGCTKYCFDIAFTLHHHDHTAAEDAWTTATLSGGKAPETS
jgi:hypothetical protein